MALSRKDILKRIRYTRRVHYDIVRPRDELVESSPRPERMFRPVKSMIKQQPAQPALTPTQHALINEIPQKYNQSNHAVRSFMVNYLSSREPGGLIRHLSKHFDYPVPEGVSFDTSRMGHQAALDHVRMTDQYLNGLEHHLDQQGDKNYNHNIVKAMGDYLDKTQRSDKVINQMHQHFSKT